MPSPPLPAALVERLRSDISSSLFCRGSAQQLKEGQAGEKQTRRLFFPDDLSGPVFAVEGCFWLLWPWLMGMGCSQQGDGFVTANGEVRKPLRPFSFFQPRRWDTAEAWEMKYRFRKPWSCWADLGYLTGQKCVNPLDIFLTMAFDPQSHAAASQSANPVIPGLHEEIMVWTVAVPRP